MKTNYAAITSPQNTPQSEPLPGDTRQVKNNAGGFVYKIDPWGQLDRFLILGAVGGTYYVGERKLVKDNAENIIALIKQDGARVLKITVETSVSGRAISNDPAIFVLALLLVHANEEVRKALYLELPKVARIGTDLFHFCEFAKQLGKRWSGGLRRAVARWYTGRSADQAAYQAVKYQQRDGWSHADVLRLSHASAPEGSPHDALFRFIMEDSGHATIKMANQDAVPGERRVTRRNGKGDVIYQAPTSAPAVVLGLKALRAATTKQEVCRVIRDLNMPRETVPTQWLNEVSVWEALLEKMPLGAMVRSLGKMSAVGLLKPLSVGTKLVLGSLSNKEALRKSRLHPFKVLLALRTYQQGHGDKGSLTWDPVQAVVDALDEAFYLCFTNVVPTGKPHVLGVDISGSMDGAHINGTAITAREGAAAMALVTAAVEPLTVILGYTAGAGRSIRDGCGVTEIQISKKMRLDTVIQKMRALPMGSTDCALPMIWATENKVKQGNFVSYTDNETWAGPVHVKQALTTYRRRFSPEARSVSVGMATTQYTVNDPTDPFCLDVVGFDGGAPAVIADFIRGSAAPAESETEG